MRVAILEHKSAVLQAPEASLLDGSQIILTNFPTCGNSQEHALDARAQIGMQPTLLLGALGATLCPLWLLRSPLRGK